jgi:membrane associated rhomboid family serine protease
MAWFEKKFDNRYSGIKNHIQRKRSPNLFSLLELSMTFKIIFANILFFIAAWIAISFGAGGFIQNNLMLIPKAFFTGKFWTVFTSMFLHLQPFHLFANMISLFFIGGFLEKIIGKKRFLSFYILSGCLAGIFYATFAFLFGTTFIGVRIFGGSMIPAVGASGAIFGLLGILAMLTPKNKVYLIAGPIIAIVVNSSLPLIFNFSQPVLGTISILFNLYIFFSIYTMFSFNQNLRKYSLPLKLPFWMLPFVAIIPLVIVGLFVSLPIGNSAHLGGLLVGLIYGLYLKHKYPKKTKMISRAFS